VTRESKDYFHALRQRGVVCCYANVSSIAPPPPPAAAAAPAAPAEPRPSAHYGLTMVHKRAALPVEVVDARWYATQA